MIDFKTKTYRCICGGAFLKVYLDSVYFGLQHAPRTTDAYCFVWSTFEIAYRLWLAVAQPLVQFKIAIVRWLRPETFQYICYYCGTKTRQTSVVDEGKTYPPCCIGCLEKWEPLEEEK
jgi:hypothetical protein